MEKNIDNFLNKFIYGKNITYQKISLLNKNDNSHILNDWDNRKSVTLVDVIKQSASDPNIYFDYIKSPINNTDMYQIHLNAGLLDESKLLIILSEIFDNKNTNIDYLKTLMKPLFKEGLSSPDRFKI
jgi:hypothetical protein